MIQDFLASFMYFTRIPVGRYINYSKVNMNRSTKFYPLVGWIVGIAASLVFTIMFWLIPITPALILSTSASILLTGAFHEDGFSDTCDGFGGGWEKDKILSIMKDSRVGAYGSIGTILILFAKISFLSEMYVNSIPFVLIVGHTISRFVGVSSMMILPYVRMNDDTSKAKNIIKKFSAAEYSFMFICSMLPFLLLESAWYLLSLLPLIILFIWMNRWFKKWLGGYSGDCLGALQQVAEIMFYLSVLIIQKNII